MKDNKISDIDKKLFRDSVQKTPCDYQKLKYDITDKSNTNKIEIFISKFIEYPIVTSEDILKYQKIGISDRVMQKLKRGFYKIMARLDLHNMTQNEANDTLNNFITKNAKYHYCLIIHGKSSFSKKSILKSFVNYYLRQHPLVNAFCSAKNVDGGTGAVYVFLKNYEY